MISYLTLTQPDYSQKIRHIRAAAALWIFVFHYYQFIAHSPFSPLESFNLFYLLVYHGYFCVYIFFLLSGFLLSKAYADKLDLKSFYIKRVGRILPAYYLCLAVYCLLYTYDSQSINLLFAIFNIDTQVYPNALGHLWFINRLLECYLCFPLLCWLNQKTGKSVLFFVYLACILIGAYWFIENKISLPVYYGSFVLCLSYFIFGMLAANQPANSNQLIYAVIALLIFTLMLEWFHHYTWQRPITHSWLGILWFNGLAVIFAVLIRSYLYSPFILPEFLDIILQKLGDISYEFYLYHFLVIMFFIQHKNFLLSNDYTNFIGLLVLSILSALFFHHLLSWFIRSILYLKCKLSTKNYKQE